jgi:hypothetical protein
LDEGEGEAVGGDETGAQGEGRWFVGEGTSEEGVEDGAGFEFFLAGLCAEMVGGTLIAEEVGGEGTVEGFKKGDFLEMVGGVVEDGPDVGVESGFEGFAY